MTRSLKSTILIWCLLVSGLWITTEAQNSDRTFRYLIDDEELFNPFYPAGLIALA